MGNRPGDLNIDGEVSLSGIRYRVSFTDDAVLFADVDRIGPCYKRLMFTRRASCWYVQIESSNGAAMVSHIVQAMELVKFWFGDSFEGKRGENLP